MEPKRQTELFLLLLALLTLAWETYAIARWSGEATISRVLGEFLHKWPPYLLLAGAGSVLFIWHIYHEGKP